jgi:hypothetical protein
MRHTLCIALGGLLFAGACSEEQEAPELGQLDWVTYNSLAPHALLANGDALDTLAGGALNGASTSLVNSDEGRSLLSYVVRCALGATDTASFPRAGGLPLLYTGQLGFAPGWKTAALGQTGRKLMTGCLLAHVNAFGTQVPISVRNATVGDADASEQLLFPSQEMAVYGNYLAPASEREIYVCFGEAIAEMLGSDASIASSQPSYLDLRVCSQNEACGFNRVGACYRWPSHPSVTEAACEDLSGTLLESCHEAPIEQGTTPAWEETVTVYLQPAHLVLLLTEYLAMVCEISDGAVCETL